MEEGRLKAIMKDQEIWVFVKGRGRGRDSLVRDEMEKKVGKDHLGLCKP